MPNSTFLDIPLYDGMEAQITIDPGTVQGNYAYGVLFDADARVIADTPSAVYLDCHQGIVSDVLHALMTASGIPGRDWNDGITCAIDGTGLECHCDCEPGDCPQCDADAD